MEVKRTGRRHCGKKGKGAPWGERKGGAAEERFKLGRKWSEEKKGWGVLKKFRSGNQREYKDAIQKLAVI